MGSDGKGFMTGNRVVKVGGGVGENLIFVGELVMILGWVK